MLSSYLSLTPTLSRAVLPYVNQPQLVYALLEVTPSGAAVNARMPLNLALVLDRSGSMAIDDRIRCLRQAVQFLIDQLEPEDRIAIVTFTKSAEVILPSQPARDRNALMRKANQVDTENIPAETIRYWKTHQVPSETDALPALKAGIAEVRKARGGNFLSRVILLTDGDLMRPDEIVRTAQGAGSDGIPVVALGVGADWNESLLQQVAQESSGVADYIAKPDEILTVFQNTMASMQATVMQNAALSLRVAAGIQIRNLWRVMPLISDLGRSPNALLGDIEKDAGQTLLVEFMLPARVPGNYRVAQVEVSYDIPALGVVGERAATDLFVRVAPDNAQYPVNPRVMNIAERVTAFRLQTRALQDAQSGNTPAATQKLRSAATILLNQGEIDLARTLRVEADNLERQGEISSEGSKTIKFKGGKTQRL